MELMKRKINRRTFMQTIVLVWAGMAFVPRWLKSLWKKAKKSNVSNHPAQFYKKLN